MDRMVAAPPTLPPGGLWIPLYAVAGRAILIETIPWLRRRGEPAAHARFRCSRLRNDEAITYGTRLAALASDAAMGLTPLFFGDPQQPLFGAYHPAAAGSVRRVGVVLCYPGPQEYMFAHRAFGRLAESLAQRGYPALRFDYTGTGDSAAELDSATLARWKTDILTAADELTELAATTQLSIVGMRLGAALAAEVAAGGSRRFRDVILWDPIVRGRGAVDELRAIDAQRYAMSHVRRAPPPIDELCGFAFPAQLRRELDRLDLLELPKLAAQRVMVLTSEEDADAARLAARLRERGNDVTFDLVPDPEVAAKRASLAESLLSRTMVDAVVGRIAA
jgi:alpha-beta hydrolase superfamily lysophospholipase